MSLPFVIPDDTLFLNDTPVFAKIFLPVTLL